MKRLMVWIVVSMCCGASIVSAQTTAPPEGWVILPVDEYRQLRDRANPSPPQPTSPPLEATLTRVDYDLRVDADSVVGRALLTIDVLREGWTHLAIPAGLMVREATLDGQPVPLVDLPAGAAAATKNVLLSRAGRSVLSLDIALPLTAAAGSESITLPSSPAPISRARIALPKSGVDLSLAGGFLADHVEAATESRWTAFGRPNQVLTMTWKRKVDDRRAELPLRLRARITELVGLGEDAAQVSTDVRVEVVQGMAREVTLALPPELVVNLVNGATVADWTTGGGALRVKFLEPVATETSFVVQADARAAREGTITVPLVRLPAAERETGGVAVDVVGAGEIGGRQVRNLEPADPSELGELVAGRDSPSMIAFRHRPLAGVDARSLSVAVVRYTPQAVMVANVEEARYRALAAEDGNLLVEARYAIRNNQRSFLKVTLPPNSTLWSARVAARPVRPGVAEGSAVLLPLEKGRAGEEAPTFVVQMLYLQRVETWKDKAHARVDLPALDLPVSRTGVELHYSPRYRVDPQPGSFRVDSDPGPSAEALRNPAPPPPAAAPQPAPRDAKATAGLQALVDRYRNEGAGRTVIGSLPVNVAFPTFGPSVFLASELTAETQAPSVELVVRRVNH